MDLLERAEHIDGYRTACASNTLNARARQGQAYTPFFVGQATAVQVATTAEWIPLLDGADIVILHPSADNGFPHTRGTNLVCLPAEICTSPEFEQTLVHEAIHIHQRKNLTAWASALQKASWTPIPKGAIPLRFQERCRINPDTIYSPFWAWESYHVCLPQFISTSSPTLSDVGMKWLDLRMMATLNEAPSSFTATFGRDLPQPEHPFEIYAVKMAAANLRTPDAVNENLLHL